MALTSHTRGTVLTCWIKPSTLTLGTFESEGSETSNNSIRQDSSGETWCVILGMNGCYFWFKCYCNLNEIYAEGTAFRCFVVLWILVRSFGWKYLSLLNIHLFSWKAELQRNWKDKHTHKHMLRDRENINPIVMTHCLIAYNGYGWSGLSQESVTPSESPPRVVGVYVPGPFFSAFLDTLEGNWMGCGSTGTWTGTHMEFWCHRLWVNLLCHTLWLLKVFSVLLLILNI